MLIEKEAKSAEEAIEEICKELGKEREELEFEIIEERQRGIFGLMGNKRVKVRAKVKEPRGQTMMEVEDEGLRHAKMILEKIISGINVQAQVEGKMEGDGIYLNIKGDGSGLLIGRHGQTLDAIQYIVGRMVGKQLGEKRVVIVDTEEYRERRKENLEQLAHRMAEKAKSTGRPVNLQPMNSKDRRTVHLALKDDRELETRSEGERELKSVKIIPRMKRS